MKTTKIEWTDKTWNPVTGCEKTSAGCAHCYAETMAHRLQSMRLEKYAKGFKVTLHPEDLQIPTRWRAGCNIFVCSMGDLFHEDVPFDFVDQVMGVIQSTPQHRYQLLTKRAERMAEYFSTHDIPSNVWLGVTAECKATVGRIDCIRNLDASVKFVSCEPLLEDLGNINLDGINWIIVGGESGNQARPMQEEWVLNLKQRAETAGVAFFFKQWGTWGQDGIKRNKHANGKLLQGQIVQQMPMKK